MRRRRQTKWQQPGGFGFADWEQVNQLDDAYIATSNATSIAESRPKVGGIRRQTPFALVIDKKGVTCVRTGQLNGAYANATAERLQQERSPESPDWGPGLLHDKRGSYPCVPREHITDPSGWDAEECAIREPDQLAKLAERSAQPSPAQALRTFEKGVAS
ncbi:hypothetical protein LIA77_03376 [Sarocladium implicatum]|nr:hypothetical protein LIA77_03376 [Sarocladium implicatum]